MLGRSHSLETRQKISEALRGRKLSTETRQKMSVAKKGEKNPCWGRRGEKNPSWKGGRKRTTQGYILILEPDHPRADQRGYVLEHRLIMEGVLGRYLESWEIVHHRNSVKDDNRVENLELVVQRNHRGKLQCPHCRRIFIVR